jgi:hypothetical protein
VGNRKHRLKCKAVTVSELILNKNWPQSLIHKSRTRLVLSFNSPTLFYVLTIRKVLLFWKSEFPVSECDLALYICVYMCVCVYRHTHTHTHEVKQNLAKFFVPSWPGQCNEDLAGLNISRHSSGKLIISFKMCSTTMRRTALSPCQMCSWKLSH